MIISRWAKSCEWLISVTDDGTISAYVAPLNGGFEWDVSKQSGENIEAGWALTQDEALARAEIVLEGVTK